MFNAEYEISITGCMVIAIVAWLIAALTQHTKPSLIVKNIFIIFTNNCFKWMFLIIEILNKIMLKYWIKHIVF